MSLSPWEQHALDSIKDRLASSDPTLVARLTIFTRLASDEEMPGPREDSGRLGTYRPGIPAPVVAADSAAATVVGDYHCADRGRAGLQPWWQPRHLHEFLGHVLHRRGIRSQLHPGIA